MKEKKMFKTFNYLLAVITIIESCLASQGTPSQSGSQPAAWMELLKFAPFIGLFYYMLYYQPKKREKEHKTLINALNPGQKVLLNNGMYGTIVKISPDDEVAQIEIADNVVINVLKSVISSSNK
ncbi:MAG: preprotein translocase subunit YajC [Candidatus Puniceispirillum sp.]|nr:preprotein translocase subunit YajC [Candidatus Pelagibacter sp.]MBA4282845.1 preprotein translocase subunit YajC [Candidatus Puniceispirillum sp.]